MFIDRLLGPRSCARQVLGIQQWTAVNAEPKSTTQAVHSELAAARNFATDHLCGDSKADHGQGEGKEAGADTLSP